MSKPTIAIFGASGLVGSALCERMYYQYGPCFRALIHTFGSAARIGRFPIEIRQVNLLEYEQVRRAIADCECVVNCILGDRTAMVRGLKNMIRAAMECRTKKFIHLGSIAIYGEDPAPDCDSEDAAPTPTTEYGRIKQRQDELVFEMYRRGVPSVVLCPGHVTGPYSTFILGAVERLLANDFVLVDGGCHPTNHTHVDNLVEAIIRTIQANQGWGERYFVTESERPTWAQFFSDLRDILGLQYEFGEVGRDDVTRHLVRTPKTKFFSDCSKALAVAMREGAREFFHSLSPELQSRIKTRLKRPRMISMKSSAPDLSQRFIAVQVRRPYFAPRKIHQRMGYKPILTYREGMETIRSWYDFPNSA